MLIVLDEPRWALYRAAGLIWLGGWGLLVGFALGVLEWSLRTRPWLAENRSDSTTWLILVRLAISSLLFALTGNFWLTSFSQTAGWFVLSLKEARSDGRS